MGLARGGARGSGSRYRARCAVVLRWLRLRLPGLRLRLWHRVQLSVLRLWLWQGHCPPSSLRRRLASRLVKSRTKASRRVSAERAPSLTLRARRGPFKDEKFGKKMMQRTVRYSAIAAIIPACLLSVAMLIPADNVAQAKSRTAVAC